MNVNFNTNSSNTNFGALYMPLKKDIIGRTDIFYANLVDMARPGLEELAKNVDISVKPMSALNPGFEIIVGQIVESPWKRFFGLRGETVKDQLNIATLPADCNIVDVLISTVAKAKDEFVRYKDYMTHSW